MYRRRFVVLLGVPFSAGCLSGESQEPRSPRYRLEIYNPPSNGESVLRIRISNEDSGEQVYDRETVFDAGERKDFDEHFEAGVAYDVSIRTETSLVFDRTIYSYEGYKTYIENESALAVESHIEV